MTFNDVDWLVSQWAAWSRKSDGALKKLGAAKAKWQMDYRAPFDPENEVDHLTSLDVDENLCGVVDRVMAALLNQVPNTHYRVWLLRHRLQEQHSEVVLEAAFNSFLIIYEEKLSKREQMVLNATRGRRRP